VPERLTVDGTFWGDALFWQGSEKGWTKSGFGFYNRLATLGATGTVVKNVDLRLDFDLNQILLRDLFVEWQGQNGLKVRAGQFLMPLSFECEAPETKMKVDDYSLLYSTLHKINNPRDIGLLVSYENPCSSARVFRAMGMVVNGTGPNTGDNNSWKDVCGRLVFKPGRELDLWLGGRLYYGWVFSEGVRLLSFAGEMLFYNKPFSLQVEGIYRRFRNFSVPAGYAEVSADAGFFEPAVRFEAIRWEQGNWQWRASAGLGLRPFAGVVTMPTPAQRLQFFIGYQYHVMVGFWVYQGITARLKASL